VTLAKYEDVDDHRSYMHNLSSFEIKAWKKFRAWTGFEPRTSTIPKTSCLSPQFKYMTLYRCKLICIPRYICCSLLWISNQFFLFFLIPLHCLCISFGSTRKVVKGFQTCISFYFSNFLHVLVYPNTNL